MGHDTIKWGMPRPKPGGASFLQCHPPLFLNSENKVSHAKPTEHLGSYPKVNSIICEPLEHFVSSLLLGPT